MITGQDAVDDLYRIAVTEEKATSTSRLDVLADYCVQELTRRGLTDVDKEASIPGAGREKKWDVAWQYDVAEDSFSPKHGSTWCDLFRERATSLFGRRARTTGTLEDFVLVEVDFSSGSSILATSQPFDVFFDTLVEQVGARNPNAISA